MARTAAAKPDGTTDAGKPKRASRRTAPAPDTLTALGLDRLVGLVLDETARNPAFRKLVTAAIAGLQGPDAVAALIDRRLNALERARGYIDWQKRRAFAADLDATVSTIAGELRLLDPAAALDRLVRFLSGAGGVLDRVDDATGQVHGVYERASQAASALAGTLPADAAARFALRLVPLLDADGFGILETLMHAIIPGLPDAALGPLDAALAAAAPASPEATAKGPARPDARAGPKALRLVRMRQALADRRGDVDAFVALERGASPERPDRLGVAERLLAAGRAREALDWVRRPQPRGLVIVTRAQALTGIFDPEAPERARLALEIRILDALGRPDEAQALRRRGFETALDRDLLRDYVARLPDFEDEEALARAFDHAAAHAQPHRALSFFVHWPNLERAARLVLARPGAWEGERYEVLGPAADALEAAHPVAASLLYRRLVDDILDRGRSSAYGHGARHLARLDALAERIGPGDLTPDPAAYRASLRKAHGRKAAFWAQVGDTPRAE